MVMKGMRQMSRKLLLFTVLTITGLLTGCTKRAGELQQSANTQSDETLTREVAEAGEVSGAAIMPGIEIMMLEDGFSAVSYDKDDWFDDFLAQGGASSDAGVVDFLTGHMRMGESKPVFQTDGFGCSTLAVKNPEGEALFGRNFDWQTCEAMVVRSNPAGGEGRYASISTVNMDFIRSDYGAGLSLLPDEVRTLIALYAPLDGMNEEGLAVSVNMIQDSDVISQDTGKPDLTTTTAIRLLLNQAADVEEALALLGQYDMHSSMGMMVHFALADRSGRSVVVEYVDNEMVVTDTPVVTNFYLADGKKQGIGTAQSHTRYEILMKRLEEDEAMDMEQVRDALDSVSKDEVGAAESPLHGRSAESFESTEWSIVFHLNSGEARYYHRENYENSYVFTVNEEA